MGSNIDPELNLRQAAFAIRRKFPGVRFSRVYRSAAVGMAGDDFLNACCLFETEMPRTRLIGWLKRVEDAQGRERLQGAWQPRTIDLDLLMLGDAVLDDDLHQYAHIYIPAGDLVDTELPDTNPDALALVPVRL